jgi:hypothetical protein
MLNRAKELSKTKSLADIVVLLALTVGWVTLVFLGLKQEIGPLWGALALVLMFCINHMAVIAVACGFACWGAYAALQLHWAIAILLGIPLFPALAAGLAMSGLKGLWGLCFKKADKAE